MDASRASIQPDQFLLEHFGDRSFDMQDVQELVDKKQLRKLGVRCVWQGGGEGHCNAARVLNFIAGQ